MSVTQAGIGYGSSLGIYNGSTYVTVAELINVPWPSYKRDAVDATNMASPNEFREYIPGLMDGGEVALDMNFIPSATDVWIAALTAGLGQFKITAPSGVNVVFSAIVTDYSPTAPLDGKMTATATLKVSGKPTLAAS